MDLIGAYGAEPVPEGWLNAYQIAEKWGLHPSTTMKRLADLLRGGRVEMRRFNILRGDKPYPTRHYHITGKH